jgi:4,4'-diaponeurosporenoate glycosyltransferase
MEPFFWTFLGPAFLCWLGAWALFARFRFVPTPDPTREAPAPKISVIVPARNEEDNLSRLLPSLLGQSPAPHEILVVDDHSSDRTAEVARGLGADVLAGKDLPDGWKGKPWACQQGADASRGDWLLFLDADTEMAPGGMARIVALSSEPDRVHSICPYHRIGKPYEELSAFFNVIMILGTNAFTLRGTSAGDIGLFGQALFLSRRHYDAVGGHERAKGEVLENFHLARHFREAGIACRSYLGKGTLSMRMFPGGLRDLVAGWSKGFVSGAGSTPRAALVGISAWLSGLVMTTVSLTFLPLAGDEVRLAVASLYALGALQCLFVFRKAGRFGILNAILFPAALAFYQVVFFRALRRRRKGGQIQWKGRDVG